VRACVRAHTFITSVLVILTSYLKLKKNRKGQTNIFDVPFLLR